MVLCDDLGGHPPVDEEVGGRLQRVGKYVYMSCSVLK